jgi:hypothetical protein
VGIIEPMGSGNILTLPDAAIDDSGVYSCTAINNKGAAHGYARIRVTGWCKILEILCKKIC